MIEGLIELMTRLLLLPTKKYDGKEPLDILKHFCFIEILSKGIDTSLEAGDSDPEDDMDTRPMTPPKPPDKYAFDNHWWFVLKTGEPWKHEDQKPFEYRGDEYTNSGLKKSDMTVAQKEELKAHKANSSEMWNK